MIALARIRKYSNIFVRNLRIFEYIRTLTVQWSKYLNIYSKSNFHIFVFEYQIFGQKYSNTFEYMLLSGWFLSLTKISYVGTLNFCQKMYAKMQKEFRSFKMWSKVTILCVSLTFFTFSPYRMNIFNWFFVCILSDIF